MGAERCQAPSSCRCLWTSQPRTDLQDCFFFSFVNHLRIELVVPTFVQSPVGQNRAEEKLNTVSRLPCSCWNRYSFVLETAGSPCLWKEVGHAHGCHAPVHCEVLLCFWTLIGLEGFTPLHLERCEELSPQFVTFSGWGPQG